MSNIAFTRKYSDAAKRIADEMTMHALNGKAGHWASFKLADGTSDHYPYPERVLAVKANKWDRDNYLYLEISPDGMTPKAAQACLDYQRKMYEAGFRIPDPNFNYDPTMPILASDRYKTIAHLASGGKRF